MSDVDFIKWIPRSLPNSLYSRSGTGGQYQLIMSNWMLTREPLHHGLNTNTTCINQLYRILYVVISCPIILYNMSFHWYKTRIEDFCLLTYQGFDWGSFTTQMLSYFKRKSVISGESLPEACGNLFGLLNQLWPTC